VTETSTKDGSLSFLEEGKGIVDRANENHVTLRLMGATAIVLHCPQFVHMYATFQRELTDLDFMGYSKELREVEQVLQKLGYSAKKLDYEVAISAYAERSIFHNNLTKRHVDIFFDKLSMCHTIDFRDRLKVDYPTVSPSDLLLEKLQIVKINEKDIKDVIILLREHEVGTMEADTVNYNYVSKLLSEDWGFYFTVTENLRKIVEFAPQIEALSVEDVADVKQKVGKLLQEIERRPKSMKWRVRARIGPAKKWYNEVEEVMR
jgi:hypothetical protein